MDKTETANTSAELNRIGSPREVELREVVERTFAWLENARRLCRDYEELPEHHESFIYLTMIRLMLRQLTNNHRLRS